MITPNNAIISSPIGMLGITISNTKLTKITFNVKKTQHQSPTNPVIINIIKQLNHYFCNASFKFNIAMELHGTEFQKNVWHALQQIPSGQTITYSELAQQLNSHPRAIGQACRSNPIPIIIPCHRVVAVNHIGGFGGQTSGQLVSIKQLLLEHELLTHDDGNTKIHSI